MDAREQILGKLRKAQQPFVDVQPIEDRRRMIPMEDMSAGEQLRRFMSEAEALGCFVYQLTSNEAIEQIMELVNGDKTVLSWEQAQLPMEGLRGMLESLGVAVAGHDDGDVRVGITGITAALAATGSLIVESGAGRYRSTSLLPDVHIALIARRANPAGSGKLGRGAAAGRLSGVQRFELYDCDFGSQQDG